METKNLPTALQGLSPEVLKSLPPVVGTIQLGEGHEVVEGINEITLPRAALMQLTSQAVKEATDELPVKAGTIVNSLTKAVLPKKFLPIFKFTNFIQWNPRKNSDPNFDKDYQPGELIFQTVNVKDPRVVAGIDFGPNGEAPKVTRYMNFLCYFEGCGLPCILSFAKTSMKGGENLNSLLRMNGGNVWDYKYSIITKCKDGQEGSYFTMDVSPAGPSNEQDKIIGKLWFDMFHNKDLKIDEEKPAAAADGDQSWD